MVVLVAAGSALLQLLRVAMALGASVVLFVSCTSNIDSSGSDRRANPTTAIPSRQNERRSFVGQQLCVALESIAEDEESASVKRVFGSTEDQGLVIAQRHERFDPSSGQSLLLLKVGIDRQSFMRVGPRQAGNAGFRAYELRRRDVRDLSTYAGIIGFAELLVPKGGRPVGINFQDQADEHLLIRVTYRMPSGGKLLLVQVSSPIPPLNGKPIKIRSHEGKLIGQSGYWVERGKSLAMQPFTRTASRRMKWIDTCTRPDG